MDKQMEEAVKTQDEFNKVTAEAWRLGLRRNKQVVQLSHKHTKAEIAKYLSLTSQRVIQILKKESEKQNSATATITD